MVAGGMAVGGWGACMVARGQAWCWGGMRGIRQNTVNERAVRILLECILVAYKLTLMAHLHCWRRTPVRTQTGTRVLYWNIV